jgi:ABC-type multidrug transport system ATPase subunit
MQHSVLPWCARCTIRGNPDLQVYDLFDDVLLLANGRTLHQGPREEVEPYFGTLGFEVVGKKAVADFLQVRTRRLPRMLALLQKQPIASLGNQTTEARAWFRLRKRSNEQTLPVRVSCP